MLLKRGSLQAKVIQGITNGLIRFLMVTFKKALVFHQQDLKMLKIFCIHMVVDSNSQERFLSFIRKLMGIMSQGNKRIVIINGNLIIKIMFSVIQRKRSLMEQLSLFIMKEMRSLTQRQQQFKKLWKITKLQPLIFQVFPRIQDKVKSLEVMTLFMELET